MQLIDPASVLARGFSITYAEEKPIQSADQLKVGMKLTTKTNKAIIYSRIDEVTESDNA